MWQGFENMRAECLLYTSNSTPLLKISLCIVTSLRVTGGLCCPISVESLSAYKQVNLSVPI